MKIVILGAGVVGVSSAYFLAKAGFEVVVIDQASEVASLCSYANGGQLSYSHIETWNCWLSQKSIFELIKTLISPNSFIKFRDFGNKEFYRWIFEFWQNSKTKKNQQNQFQISEKIHLINSLSRFALMEILKKEKIDFDHETKGILHFHTSKKTFEREKKNIQKLQSIYSKKHNFSSFFTDFAKLNEQNKNSCKLPKFLNADESIALEPALTKLLVKNQLAGGVFFEEDESGNTAKFTKNLAKICEEKFGVRFSMNNKIHNILTNHQKITGILTDEGVFYGDAYLCCLGVDSKNLLKGIGVETRIYPVIGYSATIDQSSVSNIPHQSMTDAKNRVVYSKLGKNFRAAGIAEFCGSKKTRKLRSTKLLTKNLSQNFAMFRKINKINIWQGARPFRANSLPLIGCVEKFGNLFLNTGHGSLGWTMACGSAKIISQLILGKKLPDEFTFLEEEIRGIKK